MPHILKKRSQFVKIAHHGDKIITSSLVVQVMVGKGQREEISYGITASKRVGKSVQRNRAKRRIRAILPLLWSSLPVCFDLTLVFIARKRLLTISHQDLSEEIKKIQLEIRKKIT